MTLLESRGTPNAPLIPAIQAMPSPKLEHAQPPSCCHDRPRHRHVVVAAFAASAALVLGCSPPAAEFDLIVRGGHVLDGTGSPARRADVGIVGDRIQAVEPLGDRRARAYVEAAGRVVAPGFIDTQGQSGRAALVDGGLESHLRQGITSEIIGEASTPALWQADAADLEILRQRGVPFDWSGFAAWLERLGQRGIALNLGSLVPLNQVRAIVVGMDQRAPSLDELSRMRAMVGEAMQQGAFGLSSALIYPPGSFADTEEIVELARVAAAYGGIYVSHIRGETDRLPAAIDEALAIGRDADLPVVIFHLKVASRSQWGSMPAILETLTRARASGVRVSATQYPYTVAGTSLDACLPDWVLEGGSAAALARLRRPDVRRRVVREIEGGHDGWENFLRSAGFDGVTIASVPAGADASVVGQTLAGIAAAQGRDPWDVFFDLLVTHDLQVSALYALMHDDDVRAALRVPWITIGTDSAAQTDAPDQPGRPHPRGFGTFPRVLGRYVRDERVLALPEAVHKMTSVAARQMGIAHRGELRPGLFADVVVFDAATVIDRATFDAPRQYPTGIDAVVVNGVVALADGQPTGVRAGRPLAGPGAAPRAVTTPAPGGASR